MSRGRVLSKVGGLTQTIAGISTFVGISTFKSDVRVHGGLTVDGTTTFSTGLANNNLANSTVSFGGVSVALGAADATPAFNLADATGYPTSSLSGTIANSQLANATVSFGGVSLSLGGANNTPAFDLSDATNYPTSSLVGTITNAQLAGSIASSKLANSGVSAGTVGSSTAIPIITINAQGQVTNTSTTAIDSTTISNGTASVAVANDGPITSTGNHDFTAGIDVTGNISVSGTVDGRDVATDGTKLDGIEASATADQTDEEIQDIVGAMVSSNTETGITVTYQDADGTIDFVVASQTDENFTTADHSKLDGIEASATADQTGSEIKSLYEAESDTNAFTDALSTKLSGIETSATADQTAAEIRTLVENASDSNVFTDADHTKLNGIESNATADQTDEEIQDIVGSMLAGNTESGITVTYQDADGTIDFTVASQTDENFTTADHAKLDGIEASATADQTDEEIQDIVGAMLSGNTESGITVTYQDDDGTIDFTVASQTDENFTTADHAKLDGIEASATADQTASDIKTLLASSKLTNSHIADDTITADLLADTAVSAGSYGSATNVPVITVDAQGRLTAVSTSSITTTTNLATSTATDSVTVTSSTGNNATISEATASAAGVMSTAHHDKLDGIESSATADQTAGEILTLIKTVDGTGSGLDADTVDGINSGSFLRSDTSDTFIGTLTVTGSATVDNLSLDGNTVTTSSGNLTINSQGGTTTIADNAVISGNLTVNGTTTTVNATTVNIADKNIQVATGAADDAAADGGGITVDSGDGDKTFQFEATGDNFGSSENMNLASGKAYKINNTSILNATTLGSSVVASSLTSVGTIATGVWNGTAITNANLANSTVSYGGISLSLGGTDATPAFDLSDATNYPTSSLSGTITNAQLAGSIAASKLAGSIGNSKLSNSTVSYGGISLSLGGTDATPAFDLSDATNYPTSSLSGTITNAQLAGSIASSKLANTGVTAATIGSGSAIPVITVNAQGQITGTSTASIDSTAISEGNSSMTVDDSGTGSIIAAIDGSTLATFAAAGITLSSGAFVGNLTGNVTGNVTGNTSGSAGSCTGNAATATALASARTIAGVSFDGTSNISLNNNAITNGAGYITSSGTSAACSGNAATATLASSSTITANNSTDETVYPVFVDGATGTQGLESDTGLSFNPSSNTLTTTTFVGALTGNVTGNTSGSSGSCSGNSATATALANARTIAGVSFDGTANISLNNNAITNGAGYITSSGTSAACSGNAATATILASARTIAGVSFDGSANISLNNNAITNGAGYITATLTSEQVQDIVGAMVSSNTESGITVAYQDSDGTIDFTVASQTDNNFTNADHSKLDGIESSATADQTASEILTLIKTVDGSGSGLDADTLDGVSSASFVRSDADDTMAATLTARQITPQADSTYDLGTNSVRWANVYADDVRTGDLHLSNEHRGGNNVDGSWGHYQIQEGEDDLFIMNKRSGKKFRFVLEQV